MSLIQPNLENYVTVRAASGAKSQNNGDPVAQGLVGMDIEEIKTVAEGMGFEDVDKYDKLNPGQIRMNLGNRIRGRITAIDKENARLEAKAESEDATAADKKAATKLVSGADTFERVIKPVRKVADARLATLLKKGRAKKAAQSEKSAENLKKGRAKKAA